MVGTRPETTRYAILCPMILMAGLLLGACEPAAADSGALSFDLLVKRLVRDGFHEASINRMYDRSQVRFDIKGVTGFFRHREARLNYGQFLKKDEIGKAREYMDAFQGELAEAERTYGVDGEIITAILLVETRLGVYTGGNSVLNTLSTLASLSDRGLRETFWEKMPPSRRLSKQKYEEKADKRSKWAYGELKAFLPYAWKEGLDPVTVKGSYAGALGIPQFVPTSIVQLARDGDRDGHIDLFSCADAIASVANYLRHHKWRSGMEREKAYRVLLRYNYSKPYANTILDIAKELRRPRGPVLRGGETVADPELP